MKKLSLLVLVMIVYLFSNAHADSIEHITAEDFLKGVDHIGIPGSVTLTTFIGTTKNRAYLEYENVATLAHILHLKKKPTYTVYWIGLDELPKEVSDEINAGQHPWVPFDHKKWEEEKAWYQDQRFIPRTEIMVHTNDCR
jgi:hypothetical protein